MPRLAWVNICRLRVRYARVSNPLFYEWPTMKTWCKKDLITYSPGRNVTPCFELSRTMCCCVTIDHWAIELWMRSLSVILLNVFWENGSFETTFGSGNLLSDLSANMRQIPSQHVVELALHSWCWLIILLTHRRLWGGGLQMSSQVYNHATNFQWIRGAARNYLHWWHTEI